jgi:hypothetical protein
MSFTYASLSWLLEEDGSGISYPVLKQILNVDKNDPRLIAAKEVAYTKGHIWRVLKNMHPDGYWRNHDGGYSPKYYSTVWSLILLSQLGATVDDDERIEKACHRYLDHALSTNNSISHNGTPSGTFDCLQGNMCAALTDLGYQDERLDKTYEWMAKSELGQIDRYYASGKNGPNFSCSANGKQPCAWGAVKVLLALGKIPIAKRSSSMNQAIQAGVNFLFSTDPVTAMYPTAYNEKPNGSWWKFGFPTFYCTDLLQLTEALTSVGYGHDPRLQKTIEYIISKQDEQGRWSLEHDYQGKTWGNFGEKKQPNKWVTYRALKLLKMLDLNEYF